MRWDDLDRHQPRLADRARKRLVDPGIALVVTIRRDGTPRLSPVEPFVLDGRLWLSMMWQSWKARDLLRDPRVLVHGIVTDRDGADGEVKVRGAARAVGRFHLFEVDIQDVTSIRYDDSGDQFVASWPPAREFVRRRRAWEPPEAVQDLLVE